MADQLVLYHNPRCSKSRQAEAILTDRAAPFDTVRYLDTPLTEAELLGLLDILDDPPASLVRKDPHFKDLGLNAADYTDRESVAALLAEHPSLMERPVVARGDRAVIGRPPERIEELL
jgi:arsenate reductase